MTSTTTRPSIDQSVAYSSTLYQASGALTIGNPVPRSVVPRTQFRTSGPQSSFTGLPSVHLPGVHPHIPAFFSVPVPRVGTSRTNCSATTPASRVAAGRNNRHLTILVWLLACSAHHLSTLGADLSRCNPSPPVAKQVCSQLFSRLP
jgi:hypothetical protein